MNKLDLKQLDPTWDHLYIENGTWSKCCRCGKIVKYYHRVQTSTYCDDCVVGRVGDTHTMKASSGIGSQLRKVDCDIEMYCSKCGKVLQEIPAGGFICEDLGQKCDCCWRCCDHSKDGSGQHSSHLKHRPAMKAKILPDYITINSATTLPDGVTILEVYCNDHRDYVSLPKAVEFRSVLFGKTGWNSDTYVAYYRDDVQTVRGI